MYRALNDRDLLPARTLWEASFDDPVPFVDWFFGQRFVPQYARGVFRDHRLDAMGLLVPYHLSWFGNDLPITYLVGLCTRPSERGQGLATSLIGSMLEELAAAGHALIVLIPAIPRFYQERGWEFIFFHRHDQIPSAALYHPYGIISPAPSPPIPTLEGLYHTSFRKAAVYLKRNFEDWEALLHDYRMDGGELFLYQSSPKGMNVDGYLLAQNTREHLILRELAVPDANHRRDAVLGIGRLYPEVPILWQAWPGQDALTETYKSHRQPTAMARIVSFAHLIQNYPFAPADKFSYTFRLTDPLLEINNGHFELTIKDGCGQLTRIPPSIACPTTSVQQWVKWLFGQTGDAPEALAHRIKPVIPYLSDLF